MKIIQLLLLSFVSSFLYSQADAMEPNLVVQQYAFFYKNSWKPFTGSVLVEKENPKTTIKIKFKDGIEIDAETYDENNTLVELAKDGRPVPLKSSKIKSKFLENEKFTDTTDLKQVSVLRSYTMDPITYKRKKFTGVVAIDSTKIYYQNGIKVKIELFYDQNCQNIQESYELFYTEIGNLELDSNGKNYHGNYKIWNENGTVHESGMYKFGKKVL